METLVKVVILAGGLGTRLSEETALKPKPMAEIADKPMLWHIMKIYSHYGYNDFVICLGYKGYTIKEYFSNYFLHNSDVTFDMRNNSMEIHDNKSEPWRVTLVDTGAETMTGGRLKRVADYVKDETFFMTYGDGVADVDLNQLLASHKASGKEVTLTAVQPLGRFGALEIDDTNTVTSFTEKPLGDGNWINGGFFVCEPSAISRIADDSTSWEAQPLEALANDHQLNAYQHHGFWQPMDTLRDKNHLEKLWKTDNAPWRVW